MHDKIEKIVYKISIGSRLRNREEPERQTKTNYVVYIEVLSSKSLNPGVLSFKVKWSTRDMSVALWNTEAGTKNPICIKDLKSYIVSKKTN